MPENALVIIGSGGHACVLAEAAALGGWQIAGHVAPQAADDPLIGPWLGDDGSLPGLLAQGMSCALGLGFVSAQTATRRASLLETLDPACLAVVLHPGASVAPSAELAPGCFAAAHATIGTRATLGEGVIVNTGAVVEHHNTVGANTHVATGARLTGGVTVGRDVLIGAGSVVRQGLHIGDGAIIGAGCVVLNDVPAGATCLGNPGKVL